MNSWYFSAEELCNPVREGGTPVKRAIKYRRQTCEFLQQLGVMLQLPQLTIATGFVYFHRFFALKDFEDYDRLNVGIACLFLAGKVEETPKKLKDFILCSHRILHHISSPKEKYMPLKLDSPKYEEFREKILHSERIVMQTIAFDFIVEHPYKFLLDFVKRVNGGQELAQSAWNFVNDSLRTMLCLQYRPHVIACAAIYLASKRPQSKHWLELMVNDVSKRELDDISNQILELYPDEFPLKQQVKLNSGPSPLSSSPLSGSYSPESVTISPLSEPTMHTPSPLLNTSSKEKLLHEPIIPPPPLSPPPPPLPPPPPENPPTTRSRDRTDRDMPDYSRNRRGQSPSDRSRDYNRKKDNKNRDYNNNNNTSFGSRDRELRSVDERTSSFHYDRYVPKDRTQDRDHDMRDVNNDDRDNWDYGSGRDHHSGNSRDKDRDRDHHSGNSRDRDRDQGGRGGRDHHSNSRDRDYGSGGSARPDPVDLRDKVSRDLRAEKEREREREERERAREWELREQQDRDRDLRDPRYITQSQNNRRGGDRPRNKDWDRAYRPDIRFVSRKK